MCAEDDAHNFCVESIKQEKEFERIHGEASRQIAELSKQVEQQRAAQAELEARVERQSLTIKELHEIAATLASDKEDLKEERDAANDEVDRAIAEVVTSVAEKEAISASRDEALERVATLEAALKDAETSKVLAVQDYLSGPDFAAAVGSSCRRSAE